MGVCLGPSKDSERVAKRLVRMEARLERLRTFPGSRIDMCQVMATHINSLSYGLCFESRHVDSLKKMCSRLWDLCWGTARYTANRGWTWASTIHRLTNPVTCLWLEAARILWLVGNHVKYADLTKSIWNRGIGEGERGLWSVFRLIPTNLGAQFQEGGHVTIGNCVLLDLCMSRHQWNHQARKVMKLWWAVKGRVPLCEAMALNWKAVTTTVGRGWRRSESASSLVSGSFLCASRLCRDYADMSPMCPCGSLDTQIHRLLWCPKTSEDRQIVGWTQEDERALLTGGRFWAEKGVCRMQDEVLRQEIPEYEAAPFLDLLSQEDVDAGKC